MTDHPTPDWLDQALAAQLTPPTAPAGLLGRLQAALHKARQQDELAALRQRQATLEAELVAARARLRHGRWRDAAQVLGVSMAVSFASGALAAWTWPWWGPALDLQGELMLPLLALALGMGSAVVAARAHWGRGWF